MAAEGRADAASVRALLSGTDPVDRLYGALGAASNATVFEKELLKGLDDPLINIRYASAAALGGATSETARTRLLGVLNGQDEWYVKFRAYNSLARMGWSPR